MCVVCMCMRTGLRAFVRMCVCVCVGGGGVYGCVCVHVCVCCVVLCVVLCFVCVCARAVNHFRHLISLIKLGGGGWRRRGHFALRLQLQAVDHDCCYSYSGVNHACSGIRRLRRWSND